MERVETREQYVRALAQGGFDLIISDFSLPGFDGMHALTLAREECPDVPFLFVSGTLGEDVAINSLKCGATDYVLKDRIGRLVPAVRRAIEETHKRLVLRRAEESMAQSEYKYRQLFECLGDAAFLTDPYTGRVLDANQRAEVLLGRTRDEILGANQNQLHPAATLEEYRWRFADSPEGTVFQGEVLARDGRAIPVAISAAPIILYGQRLILGLYRGLTGSDWNEEEIRRLKREAQRRLWERTKELDALQEDLEVYSHLADHNLRVQLQGIGASVRHILARHGRLDPDIESTLTTIGLRAVDMDHLIGRALAFSGLGPLIRRAGLTRDGKLGLKLTRANHECITRPRARMGQTNQGHRESELKSDDRAAMSGRHSQFGACSSGS